MKNVLFEQKNIKLWHKQYFIENKMQMMQDVLKIQYTSLLPKYIKWISRGGFLCAFTNVNIGHLKVNVNIMKLVITLLLQ